MGGFGAERYSKGNRHHPPPDRRGAPPGERVAQYPRAPRFIIDAPQYWTAGQEPGEDVGRADRAHGATPQETVTTRRRVGAERRSGERVAQYPRALTIHHRRSGILSRPVKKEPGDDGRGWIGHMALRHAARQRSEAKRNTTAHRVA
jgi:hypothetical protein